MIEQAHEIDQSISLKKAGEMFSELFENRGNQEIVAQLFTGLPGLVREQRGTRDYVKSKTMIMRY